MKANSNDCKNCSDFTVVSCTKADVAEHARFDEEEVCYDTEE